MSESYVIRKLTADQTDIPKMIKKLPPLHVMHFPWDQNGYRPKTQGVIAYSDIGLHIWLQSYEPSIKAVYQNRNDPVSRDSCMEFFFNANPLHDRRYLNFEMNPLGTLLTGFGEQRHGRLRIEHGMKNDFQIQTSVDRPDLYQGPYWSLYYCIPNTFIQKYYGDVDFSSNAKLTGNVYKCGDDYEKPHYGCWSRIDHPKPDFHRPEFFGELILE